MRVEITFEHVMIMRVETTLCEWKLLSAYKNYTRAYKNYTRACGNHTLRVKSVLYV
jgi:hypothetical protein